MSITGLPIRADIREKYRDDLEYILNQPDYYTRDAMISIFLSERNPRKNLVKLATKSGARMDVLLETDEGMEKVAVMPRGKLVDRWSALYLIRMYGKDGRYRGRHRQTGFSKFDLTSTPEDTVRRLKWFYPNLEQELEKLNDDYLIHVAGVGQFDEPDEDEVEEGELLLAKS